MVFIVSVIFSGRAAAEKKALLKRQYREMVFIVFVIFSGRAAAER